MRIYRLLAILLVLLMICGCNVDTEISDGATEGTTAATKDTAATTVQTTNSTSKNENDGNTDIENNEKEDKTLKILTIGNSFSDDTMQYMYQIAKAAGYEDITLGNLYIGGCSLDTHANNAKNNKGAYEYRRNNSGSWVTTPSFKMDDAIAEQDWDFISLQQASGSSGKAETYSELSYMISHVRELAPNAKLVWNMTWAYQQNSDHGEFYKYNNSQTFMYESILSAVKDRVVPQEEISLIVPNGTAIQNARTSYLGDTLTRDGFHLTLDMGRYTAGLTFFYAITGRSIENLSYMPAGVDKNLQKIAIESAMNAVKSPTKVTNSKFTENPTFDYSNYVKMEISWTPLGYWNSTDATLHHQINTTAGNSKQFYASAQYTPDDIPVGSIIEVAEGWQYRPEAWKSEGKQSGRPDNTSTTRIEVTTEWWGDYTHRAFNLSKVGLPSLEGAEAEIEGALTIWIPKTHGYTMLEMSWTPLGYWNSTDASLHHQINTTAGNSKQFYASAQFTPEQIPVGSIIEVAEGWQYRPEAWKSEGVQTGRPDNTSVQFVEVTAEWWGDYTHRAFNLSKLGLPSLEGAEGEIASAFTIWIPQN